MIEHEIKALQEELAYLNQLREKLGIREGASLSEQLSIKQVRKSRRQHNSRRGQRKKQLRYIAQEAEKGTCVTMLQ